MIKKSALAEHRDLLPQIGEGPDASDGIALRLLSVLREPAGPIIAVPLSTRCASASSMQLAACFSRQGRLLAWHADARFRTAPPTRPIGPKAPAK